MDDFFDLPGVDSHSLENCSCFVKERSQLGFFVFVNCFIAKPKQC